MFRYLLFALFIPASGFAQAYDDYCADLWIVRNAVFDKAGYCFKSPLGQAAFDNSGCQHTSPPPLPPHAEWTVKEARAAEKLEGCQINSKTVDPNVMRRMVDFAPVIAMDDIPVPDFLESACIGYRGSETVLRAGRSSVSRVVAPLASGQTLYFYFYGVDGWSFATTDDPRIMGWLPAPAMADCTEFAG